MEKNSGWKILVVDDDEKILGIITKILERRDYLYEVATTGHEALEKAKEFNPDLIYLDIMMPGMDGIETCRRLRADPLFKNVPVLMVTGLVDMDVKIRSLEAGANDFIAKPFDVTELLVRTKNLLKVKEYADFLIIHNEILSEEVRKKTTQLKDTLRELTRSLDREKESYLETIYRLTVVAEFKDEGIASHIYRVRHYCQLVAESLGWNERAAEAFSFASHMHDIGKVGIPMEILLKPDRLTAEEFALIKTHTLIGARMLHGSNSTFLQMVERIALTHHEHWDGSGYPTSLEGEEIPLEGRIMLLSDLYDSIRSARPYKPSIPHNEAYRIITEGDDRTLPQHFDPQIMRIFRQIHKKFDAVYEKYKNENKNDAWIT